MSFKEGSLQKSSLKPTQFSKVQKRLRSQDPVADAQNAKLCGRRQGILN